MDMIRGLLRPRTEISIPQYEPTDKVDLLVKALYYMFRRVDLLQPYSPGTRVEVEVEGFSPEDLANLDKMYNKQRFVEIIFNNKHRVLADWPQNKFRSLLILSHTPQMEQLPVFAGEFKFTVLSPESSNDEYIKTLAESSIYSEHHLPLDVRRKMIETVLRRHPSRDLVSRAQIIAEYVELLAVEVQVARLYKAALQDGKSVLGNNPLTSPVGSPVGSPIGSHIGSHIGSPKHAVHTPTGSPKHSGSPSPSPMGSPTLASRPSRIQLSAPKLTNKPSLSGLKLSPTLKASPSPSPSPPSSPGPARPLRSRSSSPLRSTQSQSLLPSQTQSPPASPRKLRLKKSTSNLRDQVPNLAVTQEPRKVLLDQSRLAVQARLMREEQLLYK